MCRRVQECLELLVLDRPLFENLQLQTTNRSHHQQQCQDNPRQPTAVANMSGIYRPSILVHTYIQYILSSSNLTSIIRMPAERSCSLCFFPSIKKQCGPAPLSTNIVGGAWRIKKRMKGEKGKKKTVSNRPSIFYRGPFLYPSNISGCSSMPYCVILFTRRSISSSMPPPRPSSCRSLKK